MELSKTQSIYYHDEWLSGESFPCPPSWSIGLQWQRWVRKGRNNRFCDFEKLSLPSLSGWYEHRSCVAHNSEGWRVLMEGGINKGSKMRGNYERAFESPSVLRIFLCQQIPLLKSDTPGEFPIKSRTTLSNPATLPKQGDRPTAATRTQVAFPPFKQFFSLCLLVWIF